MKTLLELLPPGRESRLVVVLNNVSELQDFLPELVNHCVEHRLKVTSVEAQMNYFMWTDDNGSEIEVNNLHRNKAIVTLAPA